MIVYIGSYVSKHGFTPTFAEFLSVELAKRYEVVVASDKKNEVLRMLDMLWTLFKHRRKTKLVLIDSFSSRAFWYTVSTAIFCNIFRIPYIPIVRGGNYEERLNKSPRWCKYVFGKSALVISPSLFLESVFSQFGIHTTYIPNSFPLENYPFKKRTIVRPKLFFVRSLHKIYNPIMAVEVLAELSKKYTDAELCMVGPNKDQSLDQVTNRAHELGVSNQLKLMGKLSKKDWTKLSQQYDMLINPTHFDNHPVSVIECMALGLPVVSTNVGGIPFLLQNNENALLVEDGDMLGMVSAIQQLIDDPEIAEKLSVAARAKAEKFDWEYIKKEFFEIFDQYATQRKA
jgi:glycosyltransferase involved in cell wall biosynthesis